MIDGQESTKAAADALVVVPITQQHPLLSCEMINRCASPSTLIACNNLFGMSQSPASTRNRRCRHSICSAAMSSGAFVEADKFFTPGSNESTPFRISFPPFLSTCFVCIRVFSIMFTCIQSHLFRIGFSPSLDSGASVFRILCSTSIVICTSTCLAIGVESILPRGKFRKIFTWFRFSALTAQLCRRGKKHTCILLLE
jgi:hypothetical protein